MSKLQVLLDEVVAEVESEVETARAQVVEFADAFGRLNRVLGTSVAAAQLPDVVRKRLHADAEIARRADEDRAAAEKHAQDAAGAVGYVGHLGEEFVAFLRALKTRREGAERAVSAMERERDEWRTRALTAESTLVERNREIDAAKDALRNERFISDGLRKDFELAQEAAHKVATMAAEEAASIRAQRDGARDGADKNGEAIHQLAETVTTLAQERDSLRAQVESLRCGAEPAQTPEEAWVSKNIMRIGDVMLKPCPCDYCRRQRYAWIRALIASLPSPSSPKTGRPAACEGCEGERSTACFSCQERPAELRNVGRWRCLSCGCEYVNSNPNVTGYLASGFGGEWNWNRSRQWTHKCHGMDAHSPTAYLGDAPEVTP